MTRHILGDPHLGRTFVNGVPLHRRGDRENLVWADFEASLAAVGDGDTHVMMGDLFDKAQVPYTVVLRAAMAYLAAARRVPEARFIVLRGNHDASRDLEAKSAFDVFAAIVAGADNVDVVDECVLYFGGAAYFGWHPTTPAAEIAGTMHRNTVTEAFGHWDVDPRAAAHNMLPAAQLLAAGVTRAWTGHDHKRRDLVLDGLPVSVVGSMQPYAHGEGEGREDDPYVTLSLDEARALPPDELRDRCVRIELKPGEVYDAELDCLALAFKQAGSESDDGDLDIAVRPDAFDLTALFDECMAGVPAAVRERVEQRWKENA